MLFSYFDDFFFFFFRFNLFSFIRGTARNIPLRTPDILFADSKLWAKNLENISWKRDLLIVRAMNIALSCGHFGDAYYSNSANCFDIYMMALSEPVISVKDVEDFLHLILDNNRSHTPIFISLTCAAFEKTFPRSPKRSSPKTLECLCRSVIRDSLQKSPPCTVALSKMQIPNRMKNYLLFLNK